MDTCVCDSVQGYPLTRKWVPPHQEGDKQVIRDKIVDVFAAGNAENARRRFDKEVRGAKRA